MTRLFNLSNYLYKGLDWIFPPHCAGCHNPGDRWCSDCYEASERILSPNCECCGNYLDTKINCNLCDQNLPDFNAARAWGYHEGPLKRAVHQLKYRRDIALGDKLADLLFEIVQDQTWEIDLIVPIPLAKKRQNRRGYNQAALLASPLAWSLGLEFSNKALYRKKETRTQIGLNIQERKENVKNAFALKSNIIKGKNILLIDDVITTGATLNSASVALKDGGVNKVYAITLARAKGMSQR